MTDFFNYAGVFSHNVGVPPDDVPKALAFNGLALTATKQFLDFKDRIGLGQIDTLQSVFVDNDTDAKVFITVEGATFNRLVIRARTQGWYPLLLPDNVGLSVYASTPVSINLLIANVSIIAGPWQTQ